MFDELINQSYQLRQIVSTTNNILDKQAKKIQSINSKVDRNMNNIKVLNRECKRILD
jgi:hypothetical protein